MDKVLSSSKQNLKVAPGQVVICFLTQTGNGGTRVCAGVATVAGLFPPPPPPFWGQFCPSEGVSSTIEMLNYRHTVMKTVKHFILVFVTYLFLAILSTPLLDKYTFDSLSLV